jgi:hypothetical protein
VPDQADIDEVGYIRSSPTNWRAADNDEAAESSLVESQLRPLPEGRTPQGSDLLDTPS